MVIMTATFEIIIIIIININVASKLLVSKRLWLAIEVS